MEQSGSTRITREPRTGVTFPSEISTRGWTSRPGSLRSRERCPSGREGVVGEPKKSVSMGQIQPSRASPARPQDVNGNTGRLLTGLEFEKCEQSSPLSLVEV